MLASKSKRPYEKACPCNINFKIRRAESSYFFITLAAIFALLQLSTFIKCVTNDNVERTLYNLGYTGGLYRFSTDNSSHKTYHMVKLDILQCHSYQKQASKDKEFYHYLSTDLFVYKLDKESDQNLKNGEIIAVLKVQAVSKYLLVNVYIFNQETLNSFNGTLVKVLHTVGYEVVLRKKQTRQLVKDFNSDLERFLVDQKKVLILTDPQSSNNLSFDAKVVYEYESFELVKFNVTKKNEQIRQQNSQIQNLNEELLNLTGSVDKLSNDEDENKRSQRVISNLTERVEQLTKEKEYIIIGFSGFVSLTIICVIIVSIAVYCISRKLKSGRQPPGNQHLQSNNQGNLEHPILPGNHTQLRPIYMQDPQEINEANEPTEQMQNIGN